MSGKSKKEKEVVESTDIQKVIVLIDAHALIHRAYHAMPNLTSKGGIPTGALFGLTNMLYHMILDLRPTQLLACYDLPKPTHRHLAFAAYKQNRKGSDDALVEQIISSRKVFESFGIEMLDKEGYEADDVIGTLVKKIEEEDVKNNTKTKVIIVSGDMDTMQMVRGDQVVVYTAKKDTDSGFFYNDEEVFKKYGIYPSQIADYKGLRGDTSDNIPGIKGVGEKTAQILLSKFGSLDTLYAEIHAVTDGTSNKTFKDFGVTERIFNLLKEGEDDAFFSRTLGTINCEAPVELPKLSEYNFDIHKQSVVDLCDEYNFVSIKRKLLGKNRDAQTSEKIVKKETSKNNSEPEGNLFSDFERSWSDEYFKKAQIALWLLRSEEGSASEDRIQYLTKKTDEKECLEYLESELRKNNLFDLYSQMELPIIDILDKMREVGILVDKAKLQTMLTSHIQQKEKVVQEIYTLAGMEFNLNSPKQLGEVLYNKLGIGTKIKKTKGGALSTRAEVLEELKDDHEVVDKVLEFRELDKMIGTYLEPLLTYAQADGRIHSTFVQTGTTTGRFSSINPNMQNIPTRGEEGRALRNCFVAQRGYSLLAADYSQIELRVAGMLSGDPYLVHIFEKNLDVHKIIASKMFGVAEGEVTKDQRRAAKAMNFGIIYGMGVNSIKQTLKVERSEAQKFYDAYTSTMYVLMNYLHKTVNTAKETGYTETLYGRRRNIVELFSPIPFIKAQGERIAMNAPIQGSDADIIKWAMVDFDKVIQKKGWQGKVRLILQIHDEILFEVECGLENEVGNVLQEVMQNVLAVHKPMIPFTDIPLVANIKVGQSWGDM